MILRTIDLCAGIGGIRRGFEMTGNFKNVLSSEIDKYACMTYEHLFGDNPYNDLTSTSFKKTVENTPYEVLLAGFPCQPFSRAGLGEGFENEERGGIFFDIVRIIRKTRPVAVFLENVDHLVTREKGETFRRVINILEISLDYKVIGVLNNGKNKISFDPKDFIRNSKNFGVPQNRPRVYIIAFDRKLFGNRLQRLNDIKLPDGRQEVLYKNLNSVLEKKVDPHYYLGSGYFETLKKHREREKKNGNNFGYKILNEPDNPSPLANTLLATGGSGRERNLIFDPREGYAGMKIKNKKTPLNKYGIRIMTPTEWGRLQGFVNYAFIFDGKDHFEFPEKIPELYRYMQLGNSVTIPVIETMALLMYRCLSLMEYASLSKNRYLLRKVG
jgi:DNA (cytosine-5)-methyltransferase 1